MFELIRAAEPSRPVLEELRCLGNEKFYHQRQLCCIRVDSEKVILKPIHSKVIVSRLDLNLTVLRTMASYAAADCHFRQDAHRRMALAMHSFGALNSAREASASKTTSVSMVNGEKLFRSLSSAECTEVEYAT